MTILQTTDRFYPSAVGGSGQAIYWLAKAMARAGHRVTVVTTAQDLPPSVRLDQWLEGDSGRVIYTTNPHVYAPVHQIWRALRVMPQADVVHVNSLFYPSSVVFVMGARLLGKPVVWTPHGELSPAALLYRPRLKRLLIRLFRVVSRGVVFHATSPAEAMAIRQQFGPRVAIRELAPIMEIPALVTRKAGNYLLFMGRLHPIKAIDRLLEALSESTVFRESDFTLTIAGPDTDNYLAFLKQLTASLRLTHKVHFLGAVYGSRKEQVYADAHLTILPSHSENFGNVVVESLAQGTPVIASTGTPWQLLDQEQAGRWVANTPTDLRLAIEEYLQLPEPVYDACRQRAATVVRQRFDRQQAIKNWEHFYGACIA